MPAPPPRKRWWQPPFEYDRILLMRAAFVVVAVLFLYLILKVSMIAFGGSARRESKRIEHAIDPSTVQAPAAAEAAASKPTGTPPP
jgi:fumarate reductase subunit C